MNISHEMSSSSHAGSSQIVIVAWKSGCSTGWAVVLAGREWERADCTMGREKRGIDHQCLLWSANHLYELSGDRLTCGAVCPRAYTSVCLTTREQRDGGSQWEISKATKLRRNTIPTSIDYLSTGWKVCRFMLTYKQPWGGWRWGSWCDRCWLRLRLGALLSSLWAFASCKDSRLFSQAAQSCRMATLFQPFNVPIMLIYLTRL